MAKLFKFIFCRDPLFENLDSCSCVFSDDFLMSSFASIKLLDYEFNGNPWMLTSFCNQLGRSLFIGCKSY